MQISVLAERSGLSVDTIRFYEKKGLIDSDLVRCQTNNSSDYSEESLERLALIQQAKRLGFTLTEIQQWIQDFESDRLTIQEKRHILGRKLEEIDVRIGELKQMKIYLSTKIKSLCSESLGEA
jgi:MerR family transcriptional regulator, copper efflux regulator